MKIHHVGIAVRSLSEASLRFGGLLGLESGKRYEIPEFGVRVILSRLRPLIPPKALWPGRA